MCLRETIMQKEHSKFHLNGHALQDQNSMKIQFD